jgi:hypothetical protein
MTNTEVVVERRQDRRFVAKSGAFVILRPFDTGAGRLINISMGGLMFEYVSTKEPAATATEAEIFLTESVFRLYGVPCHSVWDLPIYEIPDISLHKRRCGVQFGELSPQQATQLEYFIDHYTSGVEGEVI